MQSLFFFLSSLRLKPLFACILKLKKPGYPCKKNYLFARKDKKLKIKLLLKF